MELIKRLKCKLNKVRITSADMEYGSVTIDEDLMDAAGLKEHDAVIMNGASVPARIETYVLKGPRGSGIIGVHGGASLHFSYADEVHILQYCYSDIPINTIIVYTDTYNRITGIDEIRRDT